MNILLLGSGGREHAFAWKLTQSPKCDNLFVAPGNGGTKNCATNIDINPTDFEALSAFCLDNNIELLVVGPEAPLVAGVRDYFESTESVRHIPVIGPDKSGAILEGSKAYSKEFMFANNIPTAGYAEFDHNSLEEGKRYIDQGVSPIVLKADGLAAGKGVLIIDDKEEAKEALEEMVSHAKFGDASKSVVIEEFLSGIEFSVFVLTDGINYKILPPAKDYKRIGEGDTGLNTGGMGAVSPLAFVDDEMMAKVEERMIKPTMAGLKERGIVYKGFIYIGLINVGGEPFVIEYNARMGDPETEVVIPLIESDLVDLFVAVGNQTLDQQELKVSSKACTTVVLTSGGYPEAYEKGKVITGTEQTTDSIVFHAGTKDQGDQLLTSGGRVMAITSFGETMDEALAKSYQTAGEIQFEGKNFRSDIGFDLR